MASTKSDTSVIGCPGCGARFAISLSMVGRRARCAACNAAFVVSPPTDDHRAPEKAAAEPPDTPSDVPPHIGFECRVCGTRMFGHSHQVGQQLKCGDCGALTVVPPPPKPKPKNIPAALEGEQYELWDADHQPLPSQIIAAQPKYVTIKCRRCDTVMHASESQVGQQIKCPDCGTVHIVPSPPKPVAKRSVLAPDAQTPLLDPAAHPGERPFMSVVPVKMLHEEENEEEYARALEKSKRTGKPMEIDSRGRPIMPRWPLVTGVLPFLFSSGIPVVWLSLSAGFVCAGWLFRTGLEMAMTGDMGAIAGMCLFAAGCIVATICAAAGSGVMMQIVMESSEGNRKLHHWPHLLDWFGNLLYVVVSGMMSALPGWAIGQIPLLNSMTGLPALLSAVSILFCFPIMLLSQLDINSPWGIVSPRMVRSLAICPFSWAFFYFECSLLLAVCGGAMYLATLRDPGLVIWILPLHVASLILFARLLGRLAWRLADAMAIESK
jgi:DNA-directed RNA polymerase subunit RPC12/RpoP